MHLFGSIFIVLFILEGTISCDINICLTWGVSETELELQCKVSYMQFSVSFENPNNQELGQCMPPFPYSECFSNSRNIAIYQNLTEGTTVLKMYRHIDDSINGKWVCRHGFKAGKAAVNVTVLKPGKSEIHSCFEVNVCWSLIGYVATSTLLPLIVVLFKRSNCFKGRLVNEKLLQSIKSMQRYQVCIKCFYCVLVCIVVVFPMSIGFLETGRCYNYVIMFILLGVFLGFAGAVLVLLEHSLDVNRTEDKTIQNYKTDTEDEEIKETSHIELELKMGI